MLHTTSSKVVWGSPFAISFSSYCNFWMLSDCNIARHAGETRSELGLLVGDKRDKLKSHV